MIKRRRRRRRKEIILLKYSVTLYQQNYLEGIFLSHFYYILNLWNFSFRK